MMRPSRKISDGFLTLTPHEICGWHLGDYSVDKITIQERVFPYRVRADLQQAVEQVLMDFNVKHACGLKGAFHEFPKLADCLCDLDPQRAPRCTPPQYQEVDVGDQAPVRCQSTGLWMIEAEGEKLALLLVPEGMFHQITGVRLELAGKNHSKVLQVIQTVFRKIEEAVNQARSYRGKVLSLEQNDHDYAGRATDIKVHRLRRVARKQVILPQTTLELLDRNILGFVEKRPALQRCGLPTRKWILFYGPPGTGKTHTIHYLTQSLPGHTTLIITAEQVGLLEQYMTLARLLQPSIVVMEDVDLFARNREVMGSPCEEVLLNKLLNHMDGLKEDAEILFVLTTNRPEMLEPALAARPGRIDQAIEFPLPDDNCRLKLVKIYSAGMKVAKDVAAVIVRKTQGVSAAFIKELMRRSFQFQLETSEADQLTVAHVDAALDEMLFRGGELNRILLGAATATNPNPSN